MKIDRASWLLQTVFLFLETKACVFLSKRWRVVVGEQVLVCPCFHIHRNSTAGSSPDFWGTLRACALAPFWTNQISSWGKDMRCFMCMDRRVNLFEFKCFLTENMNVSGSHDKACWGTKTRHDPGTSRGQTPWCVSLNTQLQQYLWSV